MVTDALKTAGGILKTVTDLKTTDNVLIRTRDNIFNIFKAVGLDPSLKGGPLNDAIEKNKMSHAQIPNQKVGANYSAEWARLHQMVIDTFKNMGKHDLATEFQIKVPVYTENVHPIDYIATLLKGSSSPLSTAASINAYKELIPFAPAMIIGVNKKGFTAPKDIEQLTQLFYNEVVAKEKSAYERIDFFDVHPAQDDHVDQSVIDGVLAYLMSVQQRKNSGEVLPPALDAIGSQMNNVQTKLENKANQVVDQEIGGWLRDNIFIIAIALGGILLAVYLFKK